MESRSFSDEMAAFADALAKAIESADTDEPAAVDFHPARGFVVAPATNPPGDCKRIVVVDDLLYFMGDGWDEDENGQTLDIEGRKRAYRIGAHRWVEDLGARVLAALYGAGGRRDKR